MENNYTTVKQNSTNMDIRVLDANNDLDQIVFADWFNKNKPDDLKEIIEYDTRAIMFYAPAWHEPYDADVIMVNGRMGIRTKIDDMRTDIDFMTPKQFVDEAYKTLSDRTKEYDTGDKNYRSASEENRKNTHIRIMLQDKDLLEYDLGMIDENELLKRQRMGNLSFEKETNDFAKVAHFFDEQYDVAQANIDNYERSIRGDYEEHEAHRAEQQDEKAEWTDADIAQDQVDFMDWYKDLNKRTADLEYIHSEEFISKFGDWEKAQRIERLRAAPSVISDGIVEIDGIDYSSDVQNFRDTDNTKMLRFIALQIGKTVTGEYTSSEMGGDVLLSMANIREINNHTIKAQGQVESITCIPELIKNGIKIHEEKNYDKQKHPNIEKYTFLVSGLKLGDEDFTCKSVIATDTDGHHYYDHRLSQIEKGRILDNLAPLHKQGEINTALVNYDSD